jgi:hypothetical protein
MEVLMMKSTNNNENLDDNKQGASASGSIKKNEKDSLKNIKEDVDEFDLSTEYFTKDKLESDGEDF